MIFLPKRLWLLSVGVAAVRQYPCLQYEINSGKIPIDHKIIFSSGILMVLMVDINRKTLTMKLLGFKDNLRNFLSGRCYRKLTLA